MTACVQATIAEALKPFAPLFDAFHQAGFQLYAVGGCVRDWVLGQSPKDIDFTTDAVPEQTKQVLAAHHYRVIPVGELFGTIATVIGRKNYEITTFRVKESYTRGSRHPIVCYGRELERDLERRDLTINAMAADQNGNLIDPFDGLGDLKRRLLRVPKSSYAQSVEIFGDDPLRILRLARFKARLQFNADDDATKAAKDMAGAILSVSHERWFSEIDGILRATAPQDGILWLHEVGVWPLLFPEMLSLFQCHCTLHSLSSGMVETQGEDLMTQTLGLLQATAKLLQTAEETPMLWAALCHALGTPTSRKVEWAQKVTSMLAQQIMQRLKVSNAHAETVVKLLTPLPDGDPTYRKARELAISLQTQLDMWLRFQTAKLAILSPQARQSEAERLDLWRTAITPWLNNPESAEVQLPRNLSQALTQELGVRGKTLGLCIAMAREAVLDTYIDETAPIESFVAWVKDHFSE